MKIKICGIKNIEDLRAINEFQPDYIGFIFAPSKRRVTFEQSSNIKNELKDNISTVGVFVNETVDEIIKISKLVDVIQLHGDEDEQYIKKLKSSINNPIIKAVRVKNTSQILEADTLPCDYLLLDTFSETGYGGIGKTFDYNLIPDTCHKLFLAGGLNIDNVNRAMDIDPFALDINSGVETDGTKDYDKIKNILEIIRSKL
ncbi:N-(5'-phosphoribosyl)anthranilate isomerase [Candidatus Epulonipiscioides gigas]|nr:N-(5'-phosphoribosyl)anthranilate isomerase [Epulopiscium sp. SCG-C07WGA-EpuloA2]